MISIIMAAYNAERTISEAIQSVVNQTYIDWELIVVDDCSQDQTKEVVRSFMDSRIRMLQNEKNSGVSYTRKKGLESANGEWIAILDSDDKWEPDKLQKQIGLAKEQSAKLVFTGSGFMDNDGNPIDWQLHVPKTINYRRLLKQNLISNSSVLVETDLYRKHYALGDDMHEEKQGVRTRCR